MNSTCCCCFFFFSEIRNVMLFVNIGNDVVIDMISDMVVNTMNG